MSVIDQVFFLVLDLFDAGFELVMPVVMALFVLTFGSAMVRLCYAWWTGQMGNVVGDVAALFILFWIFFTLALSAKSITDGAGRFALQLGSGIVGAGTMSADDFGPSPLWSIGSDQADKILATKEAICTGTWECMRTLPDQLLIEGCAIFIYAAFAFLIFEMAMTILSYKLSSLFLLLFTPAAMLPFSKAFSEGAIQGVVNGLVKLTIIAMVAGIASQAFDLMELPPTPVFDDIIPALLLALFVAFLAWQSRVLASSIISAVPQLSGQAVTKAVGNVMRTAAVGGGAATSAAILGNREKMAIGSTAREVMSGAQRAPGRVAAAATAMKSGAAQTADYWSKVKTANANSTVSGMASSASGVGPQRATGQGSQPSSGGQPSPGNASAAYASVVGSAKSEMHASEAKYAAMANDPNVGNSMAQGLRAMSNESIAIQTAQKLETVDPVVAQSMHDQIDAVQGRVQRAVAKGRPADVINEKSANDYREIVLQAP